MPIHIDTEIRDVVPQMTDEAYEALRVSIEENGVREPIVVWRDIVLDGCNRFEIATKLGVCFETREVDLPDRNAAIEYRVDSALTRRHLNTFQRIELVERFRDLYVTAAKKRQGTRNDLNAKDFRESSPDHHVDFDDDTAEDVTRAYRHDDTQAEKREKRKLARKRETNSQLALRAGTNETTYREALKIIRDGSEEVKNAVRNGTISIYKAYTQLNAEAPEIRTELDRHRGTVNKVVLQLQKVSEWILTQQFECDGEIVTDGIIKMVQDGIDGIRQLADEFERFEMTSVSGIISVVSGDEATNTDQFTATKVFSFSGGEKKIV